MVLVLLAAISAVAGVRLLHGIRVTRSVDTGAVPTAAGSPGSPTGSTTRSADASPTGSPSPSATAAPRPAPTPPGIPVRLTLPGQRVTAPVVPVGSRPNGELRLPPSPRVVGWWVRSAPAGDPRDSTVLAGHVDSAVEGTGALAALRDVHVGSQVLLTDAFGGRHGYRVAARRDYPKYELPADVFAVTGRSRLVMITCGGPFDEDAGRYRDNVVVYALPG